MLTSRERRAREAEEWDDDSAHGRFSGTGILHCAAPISIFPVLYPLSTPSCTLLTTPHTVFCFESLKIDLARASGKEMTLLQARIDALKMSKFHHYDE